MTSQLRVSSDAEGSEYVTEKQVGEEVSCTVTGTVKSNDGSTVVVDVTSLEMAGDMEEESMDEGEDEESGGMPMKHGKTPIAIIAIGGKK